VVGVVKLELLGVLAFTVDQRLGSGLPCIVVAQLSLAARLAVLLFSWQSGTEEGSAPGSAACAGTHNKVRS